MATNSPVDKYINSFPKETQVQLNIIRKIIKEVLPDAIEGISYQIPAFKINGRYLIYFAGWKNHISLYPIPKGDNKYQQEIKEYIAGKGTLKFPLDKDLPDKIIKGTVKFRVLENPGK